MFLIKIYIKESYMNCYHTSIQMCGQYCILAPFKSICLLRKMNTDLEKFKSNIKQFCFCSEQFLIEIQDISWFLNFLDKPKHFEYN